MTVKKYTENLRRTNKKCPKPLIICWNICILSLLRFVFLTSKETSGHLMKILWKILPLFNHDFITGKKKTYSFEHFKMYKNLAYFLNKIHSFGIYLGRGKETIIQNCHWIFTLQFQHIWFLSLLLLIFTFGQIDF